MSQPSIPLATIEEQREKIREQVRALQAQLEMLDGLAANAVSVSRNGAPRRRAHRPPPKGTSRAATGVNEAIRRIVRDNPGLRPGEIVDRLETEGIPSSAVNFRRAMFSSIGTLKRRGHLKKFRGKMYLVEEE